MISLEKASRLEKVTRRDFLKVAGTTVASGLFLKFGFLIPETAEAAEYAVSGDFTPNLWVGISSDNVIRLVCHRSEMGQGVRTSMPMLIAEELEVDLDQVQIIQGDGDTRYGDQNTDGSSSARLNWESLRTAGATAREMLIQAAAKKWGVPTKECLAKKGKILHPMSKKSATYGELAVLAAKEALPKAPLLKRKKDFKIVGKPLPALNLREVLFGKAEYGIDMDLPDMVYASIERSPTLRGVIKDYDKKAAKAVPGVLDIEEVTALGADVNCVNGIAVIASNTWAAKMGREALNATWKTEKLLENTPEFSKALLSALDGPMTAMRTDGKAVEVLEGAKKKISREYEVPYLVHAPMEPLNATVVVKKDSCEVWAPLQDPQRARRAVAKFLDLKPEQVQIHVTLLGGGFGRKSQPDFTLEAVQLAKILGKPVKVTWTREDEIKHGFYHAQSAQRIEASVDTRGKLLAWRHRSVYPTIMTVYVPGAKQPADWELGMGATDMPYRSENVLCEGATLPSGVNIGWMRSVCHIQHAFAVNSFVDELAKEIKKDPIEYRLQLLGQGRKIPALAKAWQQEKYPHDTGRMIPLLKKVRSMSHWNKKRPKGTGIGFANHYSFYAYVAMAVEAQVKGNEVKVKQVYCAFDCGSVVNMDSVCAQIEGGIIFGLSLALMGKISLKDGVVEQSNFDDYPVLRMNEVPKFTIHVVSSDAPPSGIGEPGTPPVAPALCSAIEAATGKRIRSLPVSAALSS